MTISEFKAMLANGFKPPVEVVATETIIYQLRLRLGEKILWITQGGSAPLRFVSASQACRWLWDLGIRQATLVTEGYCDAEVGGGSDPGLSHLLSFPDRP